jgi:prepilin-type N-terminal cleavage/methylation domain-containing protein
MKTRLSFAKSKASRKRLGQQGFSLIELIVASTILLIVMAAVLGTFSVASRTTRTNSTLTDANQNVRAVTRLLSNDCTTLGEVLATPDGFAKVRAGFFAQHGFPTANVGSIGGYDRLYAVQAWTVSGTNGAASFGTLENTSVKGVVDTTGTLVSTAYPTPGLCIYAGASSTERAAASSLGPSLYRTGTDQLMLAQIEPVFVNFNVPLNPGPGTTQRIFPLTNDYTATATFSGGNLILKPNVTVTGLTGPQNFSPTSLVAGSTFVNNADGRLANRLQPYVDCLLITNGPDRFLGLVTAVNTTTGDISLVSNDNTILGLNPDWNAAIPGMSTTGGPNVQFARIRLTYYFVGWTDTASAQNGQPPILYRREGALVSPVAFNIENFQLSFDLIDEYDQGTGSGRFWTVEDLGQMPVGAPLPIPNSTPAANRDSTFAKCMVRTIRASVFGRTNEVDPNRYKLDVPIFSQDYDRGFLHVQDNVTIGLRNVAYTSTK